MAGADKPTGSGVEKGPVMNRGIIIGIAVLVIAIVIFTVVVFGNTRAVDSGCDETAGTCALPNLTTMTPTPVPLVKTTRPTVELYVMSFCPYGVQAEKVVKPVVALLGKDANFKILYIATVPGTDLSTAKSLHGNAEAIEDARQLCVAIHTPEKYWDYISAFDTQCYPVWKNQTQLIACQANVTADLGISETITQCASGSEGFELLKADASSVSSAGITSSPTILINGQKYTGSRTSESIKQAICEHFDIAPDVCNTVLSSEVAIASGNC